MLPMSAAWNAATPTRVPCDTRSVLHSCLRSFSLSLPLPPSNLTLLPRKPAPGLPDHAGNGGGSTNSDTVTGPGEVTANRSQFTDTKDEKYYAGAIYSFTSLSIIPATERHDTCMARPLSLYRRERPARGFSERMAAPHPHGRADHAENGHREDRSGTPRWFPTGWQATWPRIRCYLRPAQRPIAPCAPFCEDGL
jgi:hypothetical protein